MDRAHAGDDDESTSTMRSSQPSGVDDGEGKAARVLENPGATEKLDVEDDDDVSVVRGWRPATPAVDASDVVDDDDVERVDDGAGRDGSTAPGDNRMETMAMALQQLTSIVTYLQAEQFHDFVRFEGSTGDGSEGDDGGDEPSDDDASEEGDESQVPSRSQHHTSQPKRKSLKGLELPAFTPLPDMSVSTWIDRVDLALKGAELSGRGKRSSRSLYFTLGNKLLEFDATWWVDINRRTPDRKKTWKHLRRALLRRYG
ncbi:unnamed protein product [Phytophthora fragariaefolia]|uniref:Unnamed protein product n=1 Tax=Phytophthora fragariaefolia TaxID=1490495 RepID=A0A9W6YC79_9STRA|nr:unnamed protein product [Phytophthora fragariaefolia]